MRLIDADTLKSIKYHPLPYTHIVPDGVNAEVYERGWNDAVDAIVEDAPTIEPERKTGHWEFLGDRMFRCTNCSYTASQGQLESWKTNTSDRALPLFCPQCGADMT